MSSRRTLSHCPLAALGLFALVPALCRAQYPPQAPPPAPVSSAGYGQYAPNGESGYPQAGQPPEYPASPDGAYADPQAEAQPLDPQDDQPGLYNAPPAAAPVQSQPPLNTEQLQQLVAPIALYPDALVAQVLAAATYPAQVVDADHWRRALGNVPPDQVVDGSNAQSWDPSVKALTAVPDLLAEMDQNLRWTIALGNAYYNQPQAVLDVIQIMRQRAQAAGNLPGGPQEEVSSDQGYIQIAPTDPGVIYLPVYNPWIAYGAPVAPYRGFSFFGALGDFLNSGFGSSAIRWGSGIAMGAFLHSPFGLVSWGLDWLAHTLLFHNSGYYSHSATLVDWGLPHGGPRAPYYRGIYNRPGYRAPSYRGYGNTLRAGAGYRAPAYGSRSGNGFNTARDEANARQGYQHPGLPNRQGFASRSGDPGAGYNTQQRGFAGAANQQAWNRSQQSPTRPAFGGDTRQFNGAGQGFAQRSPASSAFNRGGQYGQSASRPGFSSQQAYRAPASSYGREAFGDARPGNYGGGFSNRGFSDRGPSNSFSKAERSTGSRFSGGGQFKEPKAPKAPKMDRGGGHFGGGGHGGGGHGSSHGGGHHH